MTGGHVGIKVNDQTSPNFQTKKGIRQGDPLSPILFNIVVDMLGILIKRGKAAGQVEGLVPNLVEDGLTILHYADDTLLFLEHDLEKAKNMKLLLLAFDQVSGLKINYHKMSCFALVRLSKWKNNIIFCLVVKGSNIRSNI
jgi:retron-type reverse transcriptase